MTQNIRIGETDTLFRTSAALPFVYREVTGRDFFGDMQNMDTGNDTILDIAYVMHVHACPDEHISKIEWLEQFEFADLNDAFPSIIEMLAQSQKITSESKKKNDL